MGALGGHLIPKPLTGPYCFIPILFDTWVYGDFLNLVSSCPYFKNITSDPDIRDLNILQFKFNNDKRS